MFKNRINAVRSLVAAGALALSVPVFAAVPADVTAAIADGTADGQTIAYGLLAFAVIVGVIMMIKRKAG